MVRVVMIVLRVVKAILLLRVQIFGHCGICITYLRCDDL